MSFPQASNEEVLTRLEVCLLPPHLLRCTFFLLFPLVTTSGHHCRSKFVRQIPHVNCREACVAGDDAVVQRFCNCQHAHPAPTRFASGQNGQIYQVKPVKFGFWQDLNLFNSHLLHALVPRTIAARLGAGEVAIADMYPEVSFPASSDAKR